MSESPKRFDEWEKVDCNDCGRYWNDSCDGVPEGGRRQCSSFLATRSIVVPHRVKALEKRVDRLVFVCAGLLLINILTLVVMLRG